MLSLPADAGTTAEAEYKEGRVHWGETLYLYVRDAEQQQLELVVKVKRQDSAGGNPEIVAKTVLDNLGVLCDGEVHELEVPFQGWVSCCVPSGLALYLFVITVELLRAGRNVLDLTCWT